MMMHFQKEEINVSFTGLYNCICFQTFTPHLPLSYSMRNYCHRLTERPVSGDHAIVVTHSNPCLNSTLAGQGGHF